MLGFEEAKKGPGMGKRAEGAVSMEQRRKAGIKIFHNINKRCGYSSTITSWQIDGETMETVTDFGAPKSPQMVTAAMKLKDTCSLEEKL